MPPNATHLCQQLLDVAVFRAAKLEMHDIPEKPEIETNGIRSQNQRKSYIPQTVLPTLLGKLMTCLKSSNLYSRILSIQNSCTYS